MSQTIIPMNRFTFFSLTAVIVTLTGCSVSKPIAVPLNVTKKAPITEKELQRWSHLDIIKDTIPGMSVDRAYAELLKNKKGVKVIVAIIDSAIDIEHEDLKSVIWTNEKEIPDNGIDDDNNGYTDDIHGWNFLGTITKENSEFDRILNNKNLTGDPIYQLAKTAHDKKVRELTIEKAQLEKAQTVLIQNDSVLVQFLGKPVYTLDELKAIVSQEPQIQKSKNSVEKILSSGTSIADQKKMIQKQLDDCNEYLNGTKTKTDFRKILGDNPEDITDAKYGNNNVASGKKGSTHGTHVAGIVAQVRNNNLGGDGIADHAAIMVIRAVPQASEYDKDVALSIRYAADNGAKVINASFAKDLSPHKEWVFDAIKYAESKDVLIVQAAGNDGRDIDITPKYPNDSEDNLTEFADNVITIGALNMECGTKIAAGFSNYGKINVDLFAPGVQIYATVPNNSYKYQSGTSMAAPNVAGLAALIRSYYPKLSAQEVKHILMDSGITINENVIVGGNPRDIRPFSSLSKSGKTANIYNALLMAEKMAKKK